MGYLVIDQRTFLRIPYEGTDYFVPMVIGGDNNVFEIVGRRQVRERSSFILGSFEMIGAYEALMLSLAKNVSGGFRFQGKWIGEKDVRDWYKGGIKTAHTLEEIFAFNRSRRFCGQVTVCDKTEPFEKKTYPVDYLKTTEELRLWIDDAKQIQRQFEDKHVYISLSFGGRDLLRVGDKKIEEDVVAQNTGRGGGYVESYRNNSYGISLTITENPEKALVFSSAEEGRKILGYEWKIKFVRLSTATQSKDFVILIEGNSKQYIKRRSRKTMTFTPKEEDAIHFLSEGEAIRYINKGKMQYSESKVGKYFVYNTLTGEIINA